MKVLRILLATPFILIMLILLITAPILSSLTINISDPSYLPDTLRASGIYKKLPQLGWEYYQSELDKARSGEYQDLYNEESSDLGNEDSEGVNPLDDLTYEEVADLYTELEMESFIDTTVTETTNDVYMWLNGQKDLHIVIDLQDKAEAVMQWVISKSVSQEFDNELAVCTKADFEEIFADPSALENLDIENLPCNPDLAAMDQEAKDFLFTDVLELTGEGASGQVVDKNAESKSIDNSTSLDLSQFRYEFTESDFDLTANDVAQLRIGYRYAKIMPFAFVALVFVTALIVFLLVPGSPANYYTVGSVILLPSIIVMIWGLTGSDVLIQTSIQAQFDSSFTEYEQSILDMITIFFSPIIKTIGYYAACQTLLGALFIVFGILFERNNKQSHGVSKVQEKEGLSSKLETEITE